MRWRATAESGRRRIFSVASVDALRTRPRRPWASRSMTESSRARPAKARAETKVRSSRDLLGSLWALACLTQAGCRSVSSQANRRQDAASAGQSEGIQDVVLTGLVCLGSLQRAVPRGACWEGGTSTKGPWAGEEPTDAGAADAGHPRSWRLILARHPQKRNECARGWRRRGGECGEVAVREEASEAGERGDTGDGKQVP